MSGMLTILEKKINELQLFEGNLPDIVTAIADSIPSRTIPYKLKLSFAISEIMLFASQFRINIRHWNGSLIPTNFIMFAIAKSGAAKDSSVKAARKCFAESYDALNEFRKQEAVDLAIEAAEKAGADVPTSFAAYKEYYTPPAPLFTSVSTQEGFIQHLNDLANEELGAGYTYSGEFGTELNSNVDFTNIIKLFSELYDEGTKEVKIVKNRENQSKEIRNFPVSALFVGSQDNLLFDESIKRKFKTEFTSKLARRSFFIYVNKDVEEDVYNTVEEMLEAEKKQEDESIAIRKEVSAYIFDLTKDLLKNKGKALKVSDKVRDIFTLYKKYNEELASTIDSAYPIAKLTRNHLQWKAFKLSGALAIMDCSDTIEEQHYKAAVEYCEMIVDDVNNFEKELVKEPYELFTEYVHTYMYNNEYVANLHSLRKLGFIPTRGQSVTNMKELIKLANSYDNDGVYSLENDAIHFKNLVKTNTILLSYKELKGTKAQRKQHCSVGFQCEELKFSDLEEMLEGDYAYSAFQFENGHRSQENICSKCKWVVLDVDSAEITDEECHLMLSDLNHFVVRTSNKNNANKFRVLLELDNEIDVAREDWSKFLALIGEDLGIKVDLVPKSQCFFSYSDRNILSTLDGDPLGTKDYLTKIGELNSIKNSKAPSKKACQTMLDDPITTFDKAFNAKDGEGRRKLIWACKYARDLGADREYCHTLLDQINSYWVKPLGDNDIQTMHRQINRWVF